MAYSNKLNSNVVEKILEQGQRLRNSMVQSILNNDPLNTDVLSVKHCNTPTSSIDQPLCPQLKLDERKLEAYLKGDYMTKEEEKLALDTFRSMSDVDLCRATDRSYSGYKKNCTCNTCREYNTKDLNCDIKRSNEQTYRSNYSENSNKITKYIEDQYRYENCKYLKFVDSLKVSVHSLILNEAGNRKVWSADRKVPFNVSETYFLEYRVPDCIQKTTHSSKAKVDSGLDEHFNRVCARRNYGEGIHFKHVSVHEITGLETTNLNKCELKFKLTYRNNKQKTSSLLGFAIFHFNVFEVAKNLTCHRAISIVLNEKVPIVLGTLKLTVQLGCGKLYFGKEFIDAIDSNDINSVALGSDDSATKTKSEYSTKIVEKAKEIEDDGDKPMSIDHTERLIKKRIGQKTVNCATQTVKSNDKTVSRSAYFVNKPNFTKPSTSLLNVSSNKKGEKSILFGFLYIAEAQYLSKPFTTYLTCQPFCIQETSNSRISLSSNPIFNFCQSVPLVFDDDLLLQFRENYTVVEFWKKDEPDKIFGIGKISLHQFYIAYRNPVILKYLGNNKLPVIGTDWWEPIFNQTTEEVVGQFQVLIALGTEQQIKNLEQERGFKTDVVKAKLDRPITTKYQNPRTSNKTETLKRDIETQSSNPVSPVIKTKENTKNDIAIQTKEPSPRSVTFREETTNTSFRDTPRQSRTLSVEKADKGIQHNSEMDPNNQQNKIPEMLEGFFKQMRIANNANQDASTTNGNDPMSIAQGQTNLQLRKTSDLLNSLQKALNNDSSIPAKLKTFRAQVNIQSALHLPSRKKCKSKRSRCSGNKTEDNGLPSTYVSFESVPGEPLKITPVVSKCSSPQWNYNCDVILPVDLLHSSSKRLIFKVWRKSTNTNLVPNMQTDLVLGFAAVDLTVLLAGLPNVQGWFNIVDFTGKCNGQINIHVSPLENLFHYQQSSNTISTPNTTNDFDFFQNLSTDCKLPGDSLSRAVKRKFTELEEITRRLRLRLSTVTNDESDGSNDEIADEFERDINTICVEDDYDLVNFDEEAKKFSINHSKAVQDNQKAESLLSISTDHQEYSSSECEEMKFSEDSDKNLDACLAQGKQRIDTLLEKLNSISGDTNLFANRYVSGCSTNNDNVNIDTEDFLKELSAPASSSSQPGSNFDSTIFKELYGHVVRRDKSSTAETSSDSSLYTDSREAPDGQGTSTDDKNLSKPSK